MAIRLHSISQIPRSMSSDIRRHNSVLAKYEYIEQVLNNDSLYRIAAELDRLCLEDHVIGFHFTRAIPEHIAAHGLQLSYGVDRRNAFMSAHGHRFSDPQRERVHQLWDSYFKAPQTQARDGRIWFAFTLEGLKNGGADRLLTYFGGESVYMPLAQDVEIAAVLRAIGEPLIVESELKASKLHTFSEIPWGKIWLSSYHVTVNQDAQQHDVDAYLTDSVSPDNVVSIRTADLYGNASSDRLQRTRSVRS